MRHHTASVSQSVSLPHSYQRSTWSLHTLIKCCIRIACRRAGGTGRCAGGERARHTRRRGTGRRVASTTTSRDEPTPARPPACAARGIARARAHTDTQPPQTRVCARRVDGPSAERGAHRGESHVVCVCGGESVEISRTQRRTFTRPLHTLTNAHKSESERTL